jgi:hypothetical protein
MLIPDQVHTRPIIFLCAGWLISVNGLCQGPGIKNTQPDKELRIVFYNVENLFHPSDDSLSNDDSFTSIGDYHWTYSRYKKKLDNIGRCLAMTGENSPPGIIGLAEIENSQVLNDLARKTLLSRTGYRIIHKDSPDPRGIDVGLLYDPAKFNPEKYELISIDTSQYSLLTREMLYVYGRVFHSHRIHLFIVHWPSRRGGQIGSEKNRTMMAQLLKNKIMSIFESDPMAKIIIMGDFNDNPEDISLSEVLKAEPPSENIENKSLINLMFELAAKNEGSYCHEHNFPEWDNLDQIIISGTLFLKNSGIEVRLNKASIFRESWLLDPEGVRPFPTYRGVHYFGGFSDHLPVYIDLLPE